MTKKSTPKTSTSTIGNGLFTRDFSAELAITTDKEKIKAIWTDFHVALCTLALSINEASPAGDLDFVTVSSAEWAEWLDIVSKGHCDRPSDHDTVVRLYELVTQGQTIIGRFADIPGKPAESKPAPKVIRKCTEYLTVPFTEKELRNKSGELASKTQEVKNLENRKSSVVASIASSIKEVRARIDVLAENIRSGSEMRDVRCE